MQDHPKKSPQTLKERKYKVKPRRLSDQAKHLINSLIHLYFSRNKSLATLKVLAFILLLIVRQKSEAGKLIFQLAKDVGKGD